MPYPLPLTRTEAYLAYKAGVIQQSDLKPSLAVSRNGIDAWLAYWTGLAADYPKREDGTPHILQEEEAYIAYLCGVINEYPEKCLRRVGAYLRYLISARWGRPDHPLNREELYLSLIKTQFIPSGDPSSDIEIDGTAKAAFVDVKMYGDTTQDSYTGKNLLEIRPSDNSRGLTIVNNARTGELTFSGTTTQGYPWLNESFPDLPAGTYTFSIDKPVSKTLFLRLYNEAGEYPVTLQFTAGNISDTKTTDYAIKRTALLYGETSSGATVAEQTIKPMLEAGSSVTAFEPYVGGIPSPNPEYPQTVQTVTGSQTVTVTGKNISNDYEINLGKNLFNRNDVVNGIPSAADGSIVATSSVGRTSGYIPVMANTSYSHTGQSAGWATISWYKADKSFIQRVDNITTTTSPSGAAYARVSCAQSNLGTCQFEAGEPTSYAAYFTPIELCKIGTYQDYIYKDGDTWKVHKATGKVDLSSIRWYEYAYTLKRTDTNPIADMLYVANNQQVGVGLANGFKIRQGSGLSSAELLGYFAIDTNRIAFNVGQGGNDPSGNLYYALATATDTAITDTTLIAQLEALVKGGSEDGTTYIKLSTPEPNLPGLLYVEAPKYD